MNEAGEKMAKALIGRYQEVLGDGLTVATLQELLKVGYSAALEAFTQGKSIAEALAAGLKSSDAFAKGLAEKQKEMKRLRGAEEEYEKNKADAESKEIEQSKEKDKQRKEAAKNRETYEQRINNELTEGLKTVNDELDKEIAKLLELSRTGSLEQLVKQQERVNQAQLKQNRYIDDAVTKTKDFTKVTKELQEARNLQSSNKKTDAATRDLAVFEQKIKEIEQEQMKSIDFLIGRLNTNVTSGFLGGALGLDLAKQTIDEIEKSAFGQKDGKSIVNLANVGTSGLSLEDFKNKLEELRAQYGDTREFIDEALKQGFQFPVFEAQQNLLDKYKKQSEDAAKIINSGSDKSKQAQEEAATEIQKRFKDAGIKASEAFYSALSQTDDKLIKSGLKTFEDQIEFLIAKRNEETANALQFALDSAKDFNKLFETGLGKVVTSVVDEQIVINEEVVKEMMNSLQGTDLTAFEDVLAVQRRMIELNNRKIKAVNVLFRIDEKNQNLDFADDYLKAAEDRNRAEIRDKQLTVDELTYYDELYLDDALELLDGQAEVRKKTNKKMTKEEISELQTLKENSVSQLKQKHSAELNLIYEQNQKIYDALVERTMLEKELTKEQSEELLSIQKRELDLMLKNKKKQQEDEIKQRESEFESSGDSDADGSDAEKKAKAQIKDFTDIFNSANALAQILVDIAIQQQQSLVDAIQENISKLDDQIAESQQKANDLEGDLEGKQSGRRDAILRGIELEKKREKELQEQKIQQEQELAKAEKKLANQRKAASITQAIINGALAITNIFATVPKFDFGVSTFILAGLSAASTAAQVALISQQKFAKGGFTGRGEGQIDETGQRVAGVVHQDE
jgi:hypothetical protein